jgi:hypothetical protein
MRGARLIAPAKVDRPCDSSRWLILCRQIFLFEADTATDRQSFSNLPRILHEERMIDAGWGSGGTRIILIAILATAARQSPSGCIILPILRAVGGHKRCAVRLSLRASEGILLTRPDLDLGRVEPLEDIVRLAVQLVAELETVRPDPSALEPGECLVELRMLLGVVMRELNHPNITSRIFNWRADA